MSFLNSLIFTFGILILIHAAYSVYEDRKFFQASDEKQPNIPFDVRFLFFLKKNHVKNCFCQKTIYLVEIQFKFHCFISFQYF